MMGRQQVSYTPVGISILDYIELYRKFVPGGASQESYKLDAICHNDLGERKMSYDEYGSLHTLYKVNFQKFIEYNIRDVELVEKLDAKHRVIDLVLTLSYDNKCNYDDVFTQVRMWDIIITNRLMDSNIIVPPSKNNKKNEKYVGAYVKEPLTGMHRWVASFDLTSLYPMLIQQYNISPDTIIEPENYTSDQTKLLSQKITIDSMLNKEVDTSLLNGYTLTPNGQLFRTTEQGFLCKIMEEMYDDRARYKKESIKAKKLLETETDPAKRTEIEKTISRYNNLQLAKKVSLNSAYGALGNEYFRFFDVRQASAITTAGQLSIRWIENKLNTYLNNILSTKDKDYVIASDTDSIYLSLDELVCQALGEKSRTHDAQQIITFMDKVCENKIQPFIDKCYNELAGYTNAYSQKMMMKREVLADRGIWTAKKRYVLNVYNNEGVAYKTPQKKIMGLDMIKSSTPSACREKLKESLDILLSKTEADMIEFIDKFREKFKTLPVSDIAFPRGVNGIRKYTVKLGANAGMPDKGCPIHVRGSVLYNMEIKKLKLEKKYPMIMEGEKIKFIYLKEPNTIQSNIISFQQMLPPEFDLDKYIDYNTQFEKSFLEPLKDLLDCVGWKTEHVNTLEAFFT
jgi:DNA polymerase elongation subunit (family B)